MVKNRTRKSRVLFSYTRSALFFVLFGGEPFKDQLIPVASIVEGTVDTADGCG